MIRRKERLNRVDFRGLYENIAALGSVQIFGYLLPFITLPYLTRTLGVEGYGHLALIQAYVAIVALFVNFGFPWSATRKVAAIREQHAELSRIFVSTFMCKLGLLVVFVSLFLLPIIALPDLGIELQHYAFGVLSLIGGSLYPVWLLRGLERMKLIAALDISVKLATLPFIFLLIREPEDFVKVLLINGIASVITGCICLRLILNSELVSLVRVSMFDVIDVLKDGGRFFYTSLAVSSYTTSVPILISVFAGPTALSEFTFARKFTTAARSLLAPITSALYPRLSNLYATESSAAETVMRKFSAPMLILSLAMGVCFFLGADELVALVGGAEFAQTYASEVLKILAFAPFFVALSNIFGVQVLLAKGMTRVVNVTATLVGVASVSLTAILAGAYGSMGAAAVLLCCEAAVAITYMIYVLCIRKKT